MTLAVKPDARTQRSMRSDHGRQRDEAVVARESQRGWDAGTATITLGAEVLVEELTPRAGSPYDSGGFHSFMTRSRIELASVGARAR